jgi:Zn finger protein HypA/HybF involved in hydrogenase expression
MRTQKELELAKTTFENCKNKALTSRITGVPIGTIREWIRNNFKTKISRSSYKINDEDFKKYVLESVSIRDLLIKCHLIPAGAAYKSVKLRIKKLNLSTFHFLGQGYLKGKTHTYRIKPVESYLVENSNYNNTNKLKKRLIKEGLFEKKCYKCGNIEWLGQPIALELEHINGNNKDHRIENLTLLCPNCHAQTATYRGKNKGRIKEC